MSAKIGSTPTLPNTFTTTDKALGKFADGADGAAKELRNEAKADAKAGVEHLGKAGANLAGAAVNTFRAAENVGLAALDGSVAVVAAAAAGINVLDASLQVLQAGGYVGVAGAKAAAGAVVAGTEGARFVTAEGLKTSSRGMASLASGLYHFAGVDATVTTRDLAAAPGAKNTSTKIFESAGRSLDRVNGVLTSFVIPQ